MKIGKAMKTLDEEIREIKAMSCSKAEKKAALIKLGLRKHELDLVLADDPHAPRCRAAGCGRFTFTFGVEIECLVPRLAMCQSAARHNVPIRYEGYNHADNSTYYKFVSDSSIRGRDPIECVSPVLSSDGGGFESLGACCRAINEAGARVNGSTGLHVHIGAQRLTERAYVNVFANYQRLERVIDSFMAPSRRGDGCRWCASLRRFDYGGCQGRQDVAARMGDRYYKVNPCSYARHKTIEFRQHQGSTDFEKISHWVRFCARLVQWSKNHRLDADVATIDEIPFLTKAEKAFFKRRARALN